ncbi:MAG TPA: molybdopterin-dependent oxidoreductase [Polyangiaceae bacterium]|nr:molybdopterin-dependent oxidoreductase [Polyangiaceae bacterium]
MATSKLERIIQARMELRKRWEARTLATPGIADPTPLGTGTLNRHGMPRLPVGQSASKKWPVLDLGILPEVTRESFRLTIDGAVEAPLELGFRELLELEQLEDVSDFHCVTTWSKFDLRWKGVRVSDLLALARPLDTACALMAHASDQYTTNVVLEEALKPDVLLVYQVDGAPLPREHGGPVRMITPQLYAWKGAKWINRIEVLTENTPGFWEQRGYSMTAHPWRDDRYG